MHVVGYSAPINKKMRFNELKRNIHIHPKIPDAIPYVTSYYKKTWGFCMNYAQKRNLEKGNELLDVVIKNYWEQ